MPRKDRIIGQGNKSLLDSRQCSGFGDLDANTLQASTKAGAQYEYAAAHLPRSTALKMAQKRLEFI